MADNATASNGVIFATDQRAGDGAHFPKTKLVFGPDDSFTDVQTSAPFPVFIAGVSGTISVKVAEVSGTPAVSIAGLSSGLKLSTIGVISSTVAVNLADGSARVSVSGTALVKLAELSSNLSLAVAALSGTLRDASGTAQSAKHQAIDLTASGSATLVPAVTGKRIRVIALNFVVGGPQVVQFHEGSSGAAVTGRYKPGTLGAGIAMSENRYGHFETSAGEALHVSLGASVTIGGALTYVELD